LFCVQWVKVIVCVVLKWVEVIVCFVFSELNTKQTITSTHLSTKQTITLTHWTQNKQSPQLTEHKTNNHLNSLSTKETTKFDVGNSCPGFGQSQTCDGVKSNNRCSIYDSNKLMTNLFWSLIKIINFFRCSWHIDS
jgi:hypothetical protein